MVERPLVLTLDELKTLPSVSRVHFVECAGNSRSEWTAKKGATAQLSHGLASCSEWTGVLLSLLLEEVGVKPEATWLIAEGADACKMLRSLPLDKCRDDVIVAYGQNGEAIRPDQGYPLRLVVPGFEGNINVKWVRRLMLSDQAAMARDETSKYTDLLANGKARQFSFPMEAKSVITRPSGGQSLAGPGFHEISGLAWSGPRPHRACRGLNRQRRELAGRGFAGTAPPDCVHAFPAAVDLGRLGDLNPVTRDR